MHIEIGYEIKDGKLHAWSHIPKKELNMTDLEENAYNKILNLISDSADLSKVHLEKNSDAYTSLVYGKYNDFVRFKLTERTKWISIRMIPSDRQANKDNPLFADQKNKNQLHWKVKIKNIDEISSYQKFIINACLLNPCE